MDAESEAVTKLNERLDQIETKAEKQTEMLGLIYSSVGSISSAV